jgi:2',3'-cyclic-nucleotide 2'-phosphodiesterase (5'-nucleotidase family)
MQTRPEHLASAIAAVCLAVASATVSATSLTLFHNNDGESTLLGSNGFGTFATFLGELETARDAASSAGRDVLTLSSGDNFLAGIAFEASQNRRIDAGGIGSSYGADNKSSNYYDAMALAVVGYDAITLGNHDFDFGPDVLADFIGGY